MLHLKPSQYVPKNDLFNKKNTYKSILLISMSFNNAPSKLLFSNVALVRLHLFKLQFFKFKFYKSPPSKLAS